MHLFLSAGEPSGDLHAAHLAEELRRRNPAVRLTGYGGPKMTAAGVELHYPLTDLAVMGVRQVVPNLAQFFTLARRAEVAFRRQKPDALIVTDYPGFHFALAKRAHRAGVPVYWFVPPQLWAWAGHRVAKVRRYFRVVLTALPFEEEWYRSRGVATHYVGHPYFDEILGQRRDPDFLAGQRAKGGPIVALLPGSRTQEVTANAELMVAAARRVRTEVPGTRFLVAAFHDKQAELVRAHLASRMLDAEVHVGRTPEIIALADVALAVSGSVGLELMCQAVPTAVLYKVTKLGLFLGRRFVTCPYISLVNMLAGEELYPEFTPTDFQPDALARPLIDWLRNPAEAGALRAKLRALRERAAVPGACGRAADFLLADLAARRMPAVTA